MTRDGAPRAVLRPSLYVYYDVPCDAVATVRSRVAALHASFAAHRPRLLRRADAPATPTIDVSSETWMEIYEDADAGFEATLAAAAAALDLARLTGPRHVERFVEFGARLEPDARCA